MCAAQTPKEFIIKADIPGVKKDQIKVSVNEDVLTISVEPSQEEEKQQQQPQQQEQGQAQGQKEGEKKDGEEKQGEDIIVHRKERVQRFARRRIRMPVSADLKHIKAKYEDGVLELRIPKDEEKVRQRTIPVE